jgi:16S rRNA (uracil1498-N3)-methyltransferase
MSERFHVNCPLAAGLVTLRGPEAHHLAVVCRVRRDDPVTLFNGDGLEYPGRVVEATKKDVTVEVLRAESPQRERPLELRVAAPLPKGDRAQFLVEKLTELGVTRFSVLSTARSVVSPREAKMEKLQRYVIEASKQCGRNVLMAIDPPRPWEEFLADESLPAVRLLAHPGGEGAIEAGVAAAAAVGPEGGFTDEEVALALAAGWRSVGLGLTVLRVETAALALAARLA